MDCQQPPHFGHDKNTDTGTGSTRAVRRRRRPSGEILTRAASRAICKAATSKFPPPRAGAPAKSRFCSATISRRAPYQQNTPIAAPQAAPSPPAQSSLRPAAAPSYHPRPLPRAAQRRALRFSPQIHAHFSRSQIGRFLRRSGASGRLLGTRGRARGGSIAPNSIFAGVPRATS